MAARESTGQDCPGSQALGGGHMCQCMPVHPSICLSRGSQSPRGEQDFGAGFCPPPCKAASQCPSPSPGCSCHANPQLPTSRADLLAWPCVSGIHHACCALSFCTCCFVHPEYSVCCLSSMPSQPPSAGLDPFGPRSAPLTTVCRDIYPCLSPSPDPGLLQGKSSVYLTPSQHLTQSSTSVEIMNVRL